jgi:hypothetical protein
MADLFGELLPATTVRRTGKASFDGVIFGPYSREFLEQWSGRGIPEDLVDARQLRDSWTGPSVDIRNLLMLQGAWLADQGLPENGVAFSEFPEADG